MKALALLLAAIASVAMAGSVSLPDPSVYINLASNRTTVGLVASNTYRSAPSAFVYVSECARADSSTYRCNVEHESLTLGDWSVDITAQIGAVYVASGHPYWRQFQTVVSGELNLP